MKDILLKVEKKVTHNLKNMKNKSFVLVLVVMILAMTVSAQITGTFSDSRDNKIYQTVKIGTQTWLAENLDVNTFRNGDKIPEAKTAEEWILAGEKGEPAWCYYENDSANGKIYGKLYNWYAVNSQKGLAPEGWHVSSDDDWREIIFMLNGKDLAADLMKETGTSHWKSKNTTATNKTGFSGLPGGYRIDNGKFFYLGELGNWWSPGVDDSKYAKYQYMSYQYSKLFWFVNSKSFGYSVRCIKDSKNQIQQNPVIESLIETKNPDCNLFPIFGITIGKTTIDQLAIIGKRTTTIDKTYNEPYKCYDVKDIGFWYDTNIINQVFLVRSVPFPKQWEECGFNWNLSYNEWIRFLESNGYVVTMDQTPKLKKIKDSYRLSTNFKAVKKMDEEGSVVLGFTFNSGKEITVDALGTLAWISIKKI